MLLAVKTDVMLCIALENLMLLVVKDKNNNNKNWKVLPTMSFQ